MSRLATALHAQPPGSVLDRRGMALQRHQIALDQRAQCQRALKHDPCVRLAKALEQLEREVKTTRRQCVACGAL